MSENIDIYVHIAIPVGDDKEKLEHLFKAEKHLAAAGVEFDTGFDGNQRDWRFDRSLKGANVRLSGEQPKKAPSKLLESIHEGITLNPENNILRIGKRTYQDLCTEINDGNEPPSSGTLTVEEIKGVRAVVDDMISGYRLEHE